MLLLSHNLDVHAFGLLWHISLDTLLWFVESFLWQICYSSCACGCPGPVRCHVIHRYDADHPTGYIPVNASVDSCIRFINRPRADSMYIWPHEVPGHPERQCRSSKGHMISSSGSCEFFLTHCGLVTLNGDINIFIHQIIPIWQFTEASRSSHIEAETKWSPFSRRHFQMHFLEWKHISFD